MGWQLYLTVSELDLSRASIGGDWSWIRGMSNLVVLILPRNIRDLEPLTGMRFRLLVTPGLSPAEKQRQMLKYRIEEI